MANAQQSRELQLEDERVAAVIRKHEEEHPPISEDCPICLEPITDVRHFACCGNFACGNCCETGAQTGTLKSCPLCRAPPAVGEEIQKKWIKERAAEGRAWAQFNLGNFSREGMMHDGISI